MCPVSGGLAVTAMMMGTTSAALAAGTVTATLGATIAGVAASAAIGAAIGVGIGGVMNLATGKGFFEGAGKAALFGAIGGGVGGALGQAGQAATITGNAGKVAAQSANSAFGNIAIREAANQSLQLGSTLTGLAPSTTSFVATTALGGLASALTPEPYALALPQASQQDFSSPAIRTTGSGGSQAAVSLAEAVTRSKQRKLSQADVSSLSVDTSSFASGGLQFA
tara:strand:- start:7532 stop:8203 length:672 start_codon:yes stop_codon:yes gene_type:complete